MKKILLLTADPAFRIIGRARGPRPYMIICVHTIIHTAR